MKNIKIVFILLTLILMLASCSYAAIDDTINFDISYKGEVKVNEEKSAVIMLAGENTPTYTNVRVKVDIQGPATPKIIATDSLGTQIDIAKEGYWGPEAGFAIGGTFSNETPIKATFSQAGTYTITLSLLNVQNTQKENDILAQKTVTIQVREDTPIVNEVANTEIPEELPKTGTSLVEYAIYALIMIMIIYLSNRIRKR